MNNAEISIMVVIILCIVEKPETYLILFKILNWYF